MIQIIPKDNGKWIVEYDFFAPATGHGKEEFKSFADAMIFVNKIGKKYQRRRFVDKVLSFGRS